MKRCGLYTRVSTEDQVHVKDGSLDTQMDVLEDYLALKSKAGDEPWRAVARYREEGRSGKNTQRPEYRRLLADVDAGKIDLVVCTKIDRMTRSLLDFYELLESLARHGVDFVSLGDLLDTSSAAGRALAKILLVFAELEREQISERTRHKAAWRAQKGLWNGGQILGYDPNPDAPGIPVVNAPEKNIVLLIFHTYLNGGGGLRRTAGVLNRKGYRTKAYVSRRGNTHSGEPYSDSAIRHILTNPFYLGKIRFKGQLFDGQHEALLPGELFERVQRLLASHRGKRSRPQQRHLFLLDGLVRCGHCGAHMTPTFTRNSQHKIYSYYACTRQGHQGRDACTLKAVPAEALEQVVAERLTQLSQQDRTVERLVQQARSGADELLCNLQRRQATLADQKSQVDNQIDALLNAIAGRRTALKSVGRKIAALEERQEQLDDELLALDLQIEATTQQAASAQSLIDSLTTFADLFGQASPETQRDLIRFRVHQLEWKPDQIRLALLDQPRESCQKFDESMGLVAHPRPERPVPASAHAHLPPDPQPGLPGAGGGSRPLPALGPRASRGVTLRPGLGVVPGGGSAAGRHPLA